MSNRRNINDNVWKQLGKPDTNASFLGDTANEALRNYFVGEFINATWYTNGNIAVDASDDAVNGVFHRDAIALDTRTPAAMEIERDASQRGWEVNMVARYGTGVRRDAFGVGVTADATAPTGF